MKVKKGTALNTGIYRIVHESRVCPFYMYTFGSTTGASDANEVNLEISRVPTVECEDMLPPASYST